MKLVALALLSCVIGSTVASSFLCYFPNWAYYRTGEGKFTVANLDPFLCTHYIYSFASLDGATFTIKAFDSWLDLDKGTYAQFNNMKQKNPKLKTLIAIGGANDSHGSKYSQLVASSAKINNFVASVVAFLDKHNFDGLDVDWEYPKAADRHGFSNLLKSLRKAFAPKGYVLSVAVSAGRHVIDSGYDVKVMSDNVDFINVMTYDMHGSWERQADHHAPLFKRSWEGGNNNVDYIINYYISQGASASKIILGIPLYGRSWTLSSGKTSPPAPASGAGAAGLITKQAGFLGYNEICKSVKSGTYKVVRDAQQKCGPYAFSSSLWVGYDDVETAIVKSKYALSSGLGGAMVWDISTDDFNNACGDGKFALCSAISKTLSGNAPAPGPGPTPAPGPSPTPRPTHAPAPGPTPSPSGPFSCPQPSGLFANPTDCATYYHCVNGKFWKKSCPGGLHFNNALHMCDWPASAKCQ